MSAPEGAGAARRRAAEFHQTPPHVCWEAAWLALLLVAIQARDRRIARLEELDHGKAVELDRLRRGGEERRAA